MRIAVLFIAIALAGCGDEIRVGRPDTSGVLSVAAPLDGGAVDAGMEPTRYRDEDFVEADTNRDPFRNYAAMFAVVPPPPEGGREVVMGETGIDEMRLIGIITGVADPRAMLIDRNGRGWTVRRGMYLGRPEIQQATGTEAVPVVLNWRVDRIRENELVLTREDPTAPNRPPLTRVLPLRDAAEERGIEVVPR
jgi:type IV pilus assembly protein PilP